MPRYNPERYEDYINYLESKGSYPILDLDLPFTTEWIDLISNYVRPCTHILIEFIDDMYIAYYVESNGGHREDLQLAYYEKPSKSQVIKDMRLTESITITGEFNDD